MCHVVDDRSGSGSVLAPGSLLVAAPGLLDPNFHRTVVYVIEHRDGGSLGVVLNRPSEVSVRDVLPTWAPLASQPSAVFVGGPVDARDRAVPGRGAHRARPGKVDGLVRVRGPVALVDLDSRPERHLRPAARAAGVRRVLRLGPRAAGRRGRRAATGSSCPRCPTTCSTAQGLRPVGPRAAPPGHAAGAARHLPGRRPAELTVRRPGTERSARRSPSRADPIGSGEDGGVADDPTPIPSDPARSRFGSTHAHPGPSGSPGVR